MNLKQLSRRDQQVSVQEIFWVTTAAALWLAYAKHWGADTAMHAVWYGVFALVSGLVVGGFAQQIKEALYWASLMGGLAFVAVAGGTLPNDGVLLGWGALGTVCGALAGVQWPSNGDWHSKIAAAIFSSLLAASLMAVCVISVGDSLSFLVQFDLVCAGLIGAGIRPIVDFLRWFEERSRQPRFVLTAWLTLCVLAGNFLVPIIGGVNR